MGGGREESGEGETGEGEGVGREGGMTEGVGSIVGLLGFLAGGASALDSIT